MFEADGATIVFVEHGVVISKKKRGRMTRRLRKKKVVDNGAEMC